MLEINKDLLAPKGEPELIKNFNEVYALAMLADTKYNFSAKLPLYARNYNGDVYNYGGNASLPILTGLENVAVTKSSNVSYDLVYTITGKAYKLDDDVKTALYGDGDQTHCAVSLIALPTNDATEVSYSNGASALAPLTADDCVVIDNTLYLVVVTGLYDSGGTTTCATTYFNLGWNSNTVKILLDVDGCELLD